MQQETKKELFNEFDKLKGEINSSSKELNKVNNDKELWFRKKVDLSKNIRKNIANIKENRAKRDSLTKKVKELKEKRNNLSEGIKKNISELIKLKNEVKNLSKNSKINDPNRLKGEIDKLEVTLETEAMPFEKEKGLSKKLKVLKKSLIEISEVINILNKIRKLNLDIDKTRKNTHQTHNEIQKLAKESQQLHEGIIKISKETDELETKEDEAFKKFLDFKKSFNNVNNNLKGKLSEMSGIREKINKFKLEEDEKRKLKESAIIKNKEQEIEEKIKEGKKITTEDFLAFQEIIKNQR